MERNESQLYSAMIETTQSFYQNSIYKYRYTKNEISINTIDLTAKTNISSITVNDYIYFYSNQLKNNITSAPVYATTEEDEFLLDGSRSLMNESLSDEEVGWWTKLSNDEGTFTANPLLTINFFSLHSSIGLTFYYDEWSYPLEYKVRWYNGASLITEETYNGSSAIQVAFTHVQGYDKIELEITKAKPYAYCKLLEVDFGALLIFDGSQLQGSKLKEQVSLISNQLVSDSLEFSIINYDSAYNLLNPEDVMIYFTKGQTVTAKAGVLDLSTNRYEYVNMGKFYISDVSNQNGLLKLKCYGRLNFLNEEYFYSPFYTNETVENIVADILDGYQFYVHENVKDIQLTGYIPLRSKKEALKVLCIATGAVVKEGRDGVIYIFKPTDELSTNQIITSNTVYNSTPLAPFLTAGEISLQNVLEPVKDLFTVNRSERLSQIVATRIGYYHKVEVIQKNYVKNGTNETLYSDNVLTDSEGMAIINFNAPVYDLSVPTSSNYTIYSFADCCVLVGEIDTSYSITITGKKYSITESTVSSVRDLSENISNETRETMTINSANELIGNTITAQNVAAWYLTQFKKRLNISFDWWSVATVEASDWIKIVDSFDKTNLMQTDSIEYDLTSLIAKVKGVI